MNASSLTYLLLQKIQENDFHAVKGARLSVHLPVHQTLLNQLFHEMISSSENMSDFRSIVANDLHDDEFVIDIDHKKIKRTLRCGIQDISYNRKGDTKLIIVFLEGIRFYERALLNSLVSVKKGWNWIKSIAKGADSTASAGLPAFKVSGSELAVNLTEVLRKQELGFLVPIIRWEGIYTREEQLIIRFKIEV